MTTRPSDASFGTSTHDSKAVQSLMNSLSVMGRRAGSIDTHDTSLKICSDPYSLIREIQKSFQQNPGLRLSLFNPQNEEQAAAALAFRREALEKLGQYIFENHFLELLSEGHLSVARLKKMHNIDRYSNPGDNYTCFFEDLSKISPKECRALLTDSRYFARALSFMDSTNQQIARYVLSQNEFRLEDRVMANQDDSALLRELIARLTTQEISDLRSELQRKYKCQLEAMTATGNYLDRPVA